MVSQIKYEKIETEYNSPFKVREIVFPENTNIVKTEKHWHRSLEFLVPIETGNQAWVEGEVYHVQKMECT